jgi:trimeric autotransporter adhesin
MKKLIAPVIIFLVITSAAFPQVSVNTTGNPPDPSSMLDVQSTSSGLLIPRMTTSQRTGILSPANGLIVFDNDYGSLCFFRAGVWRIAAAVNEGSGSTNHVAFWSASGSLSGNSNFYWDNSSSRLGIGTVSPNQQLEITGSFRFPSTTTPTTGVIYKGTAPFIHNYKPAGRTGANTFVGEFAGNFSMSGSNVWEASCNTVAGYFAMNNNSSGYNNTAVGAYTMMSNTTGYKNTAVGYNSLMTNSTGYNNTAIGSLVLDNNTLGYFNTGCGNEALFANTKGNYNTAVGESTLQNDTTAIGNTALGASALDSYVNGNYNTAVGYLADVSAMTLTNTVVIGYNAIASASNQVRLGNGDIQTFYCKGAWQATSSSNPNMVVDSDGKIMRSTATIPSGTGSATQVAFWSSSGVLSGNSNLFWDNGNSRLGIGTVTPNQQLEIAGAFRFPATSSSSTGVIYKGADRFIHDYKPASGLGGNTFLGINAGNFTMTATGSQSSYNTGIGNLSLTGLTTGSENTATGYLALTANTSGSSNTAIGVQALNANTSGGQNVAIGKDAMYYSTGGNSNTVVGNQAGRGASGNSYTANTLLGYQAGNIISTGSQNILLGYGAGANVTSGSHNIMIGYNLSAPSATGNDQVVIGDQSMFYGDLQNLRIGIGTTTPGQKLEVKSGNILLSNSGTAGEIWFAEPSGSGTNYTAFKAQAQAVNLTYTLPAVIGTDGSILSTTAAGTLSWIAPSSADITAVGSMTSGDAFSGATADDDWLGLGAAAGRIAFDDQATDYVNILNANVGIGIATPSQQLELTGNLELPATTATSGIIYTVNDRFLHNFGTKNVFLGGRSGNLEATLTGANNTGIGDSTLYSLTSGNSNVAIGLSVLRNLSAGSGNTVVGIRAGIGMNTPANGGWNTIIGYQAGKYTNSERNTFLGCEAGMYSATGSFNVFVGHQSGYHNTTGNNSTSLGCRALFTQTGSTTDNDLNNTAVGFEALYSDNPTTEINGRDNVAVGHLALRQNQTGYRNTTIGSEALYTNTTGAYNTAMGAQALYRATNNYNTGIGDGALAFTSSGQRNTAVGATALDVNTTGSYNTGLGFGVTASGGDFSNSTAVGAYATIFADDQVVLGDNYIQTFYCMGAYNGIVGTTNKDLFVDDDGKIGYVSSSARYKEDIIDMQDVNWIYQLRPVNFTYKSDEMKKQQYGLVAEEVEKVNPDFVSYNKDGSVETVSYSQMISPMIKAIREQKDRIEVLESEINLMKAEREQLVSRLEALEKK